MDDAQSLKELDYVQLMDIFNRLEEIGITSIQPKRRDTMETLYRRKCNLEVIRPSYLISKIEFASK